MICKSRAGLILHHSSRRGCGTVEIDGEATSGSPGIHRYVNTFPRRLVVNSNVSVGWMICQSCEREFKVWMTDTKIWRRLPRRLWRAVLCTRCFRKIIS